MQVIRDRQDGEESSVFQVQRDMRGPQGLWVRVESKVLLGQREVQAAEVHEEGLDLQAGEVCIVQVLPLEINKPKINVFVITAKIQLFVRFIMNCLITTCSVECYYIKTCSGYRTCT